jgi:Fe-S cluster biogenesis protein NfuA
MSNIAETASQQPSLYQRVESAIDLIRPSIQQDGGDVELVDVDDDGIVKIRFHGACCGCPSANMTLYHGIRRVLLDKVPEVRQVVSVR